MVTNLAMLKYDAYVSISMYASYFRIQSGHSWNISIKCRTVQTWFVRTDV